MDLVLNDTPLYLLPEKIRKVFSTWRKCGLPFTRIINGFEVHYRNYKCQHPLCPRCNEWVKKKIATKTATKFKKIGALLAPNEHFSYITINWVKLPLGSDFKKSCDELKRIIRYRFTKKMTEIVYLSEFEIAVQKDEVSGAVFGMLHVHGWCYHPKYARQEVLDDLLSVFTGPNQIDVQGPHKDKVLFDNIEYASEYVHDIDLDIAPKKFGNLTGSVLLKLLISIESIRSRGRMGLRFEVGYRTASRLYKNKISLGLGRLKSRPVKDLSQLGCIRTELIENVVGADPPGVNQIKLTDFSQSKTYHMPSEISPTARKIEWSICPCQRFGESEIGINCDSRLRAVIPNLFFSTDYHFRFGITLERKNE